MTADLLVEHFADISEAPDAVPRLRQFVLDAAVRGRLVSQRAEERTAVELLDLLSAGRDELVARGVIRQPRAVGGGTSGLPPFALPAAWQWCRVSDVGAVVGGGTPSSQEAAYFAPGGSAIAWLTPADMGSHEGLYISHGARDITEEGLRNSSATLLPAGTVLFTSRAPIGYTAIAANEVATNQGFKSVVPFLVECNRYVALFFMAFAKQIDAAAPSTTFREVSGKIVANLWFPLPPLDEQHRIVAKVDELMAVCDELEAAQTEREARRNEFVASSLYHLAPGPDDEEANEPDALYRNAAIFLGQLARITDRNAWEALLRRAIIDLAVSGRLTDRGRDTPVEQLLDEICREKQSATAQGLIRRTTTTVYSRPRLETGRLPSGWAQVTLESLCLSVVDGDHQPPPKTARGVPFLVIGNVQSQVIDKSECRYVSPEYYEGLDWSHRPKAGDVLYTLVGSYGIPVVVRDREPFCVQRHIAIARPAAAVDAEYLAFMLESTRAFSYATASATGIAQKTVSLEKLRRMPVPVPPIEEQGRIVSVLKDILVRCEELARVSLHARQQRGALLSSASGRVLR